MWLLWGVGLSCFLLRLDDGEEERGGEGGREKVESYGGVMREREEGGKEG